MGPLQGGRVATNKGEPRLQLLHSCITLLAATLTREIQFLEFMGGSNVPQALPNYLICLCFIRINTVLHLWDLFRFTALGAQAEAVETIHGVMPPDLFQGFSWASIEHVAS